MLVFIDIHTHSLKQNTGDVISVISADPVKDPFFNTSSFFSAGVHPWSLPHEHAEWYVYFVRKIAKHEHCVAIGECGLDFHISADKALQREVFEKHILISEETGLPLIIHCVKAFHELLQIRKEMKPQSPWIIHGFSKSIETAMQCIEAGCCLSFGKKALEPEFAEVLRVIPDEMIFAETDEADIDVRDVYRAIADAKSGNVNTVSEKIYNNVKRCFKKLQ
jgi:TatD DNase family protein